MAYKRAQWRSGLIYQQTCETCKTTIRYTDEKLDFRPWYADGFVYCPNCKTPLRHNEDYAVDQNGNYIKPIEVVNTPESAVEIVKEPTQEATAEGTTAFCSKCGNKFLEGDLFCSKCGTKRR